MRWLANWPAGLLAAMICFSNSNCGLLARDRNKGFFQFWGSLTPRIEKPTPLGVAPEFGQQQAVEFVKMSLLKMNQAPIWNCWICLAL